MPYSNKQAAQKNFNPSQEIIHSEDSKSFIFQHHRNAQYPVRGPRDSQTEELFKSQNYQFEPLSFDILKTASEIDDIPELHDRLIAATARYLGLPLISNDPVIMNSRFVEVLD